VGDRNGHFAKPVAIGSGAGNGDVEDAVDAQGNVTVVWTAEYDIYAASLRADSSTFGPPSHVDTSDSTPFLDRPVPNTTGQLLIPYGTHSSGSFVVRQLAPGAISSRATLEPKPPANSNYTPSAPLVRADSHGGWSLAWQLYGGRGRRGGALRTGTLTSAGVLKAQDLGVISYFAWLGLRFAQDRDGREALGWTRWGRHSGVFELATRRAGGRFRAPKRQVTTVSDPTALGFDRHHNVVGVVLQRSRHGAFSFTATTLRADGKQCRSERIAVVRGYRPVAVEHASAVVAGTVVLLFTERRRGKYFGRNESMQEVYRPASATPRGCH
jgi:hypothetical protein